MIHSLIRWNVVAIVTFGLLSVVSAEQPVELKVHVAQANNDSSYIFVRAKFQPGEVSDPWAVRFFDGQGKEVPYFVWDSVNWKVARDGRADWGNRYALLNHGPGDSKEVETARTRKIEGVKKAIPQLGAQFEYVEKTAKEFPDSQCAVLYLLKHRVPPFGKDKLTLRIFKERQIDVKPKVITEEKVTDRPTIQLGDLQFDGLPDRLTIRLKDKEILRHAGFNAGGHSETSGHADATKPTKINVTQTDILTKVTVTSKTAWQKDGTMDWQCTYWLFPEGGFVALEGFSLSNPGEYRGGPQKMSLWQTNGEWESKTQPTWDQPWWIHKAGDCGFVATHLFQSTPLTIGFGNNPFAVNGEGPNKDPNVAVENRNLAMVWNHQINDPAIERLMTPQPMRRPNDPAPKDPPAPPQWKAKIDWLYRQYACGLDLESASAEKSLRQVLGAAAGWIDRPVTEELIATRFVQMMPRIAKRGESSELGLLKVIPSVLADDRIALSEALRKYRDPVERTDYYIDEIRKHVAGGGKPSEGRKKAQDGSFHEGWTGNPCYHAALMPTYVRVLEHYELQTERNKSHRDAIVNYADFTLKLLGGDPFKVDPFGEISRSEWPSRIIPVTPVMLHANSIKPNENYTKAVKQQFNDLYKLVERNPHGYFPVWTWTPKADRYDTVYNAMTLERGLTSLWWEDQLAIVGKEKAGNHATAQARWFVFSGQLLDSLETDNPTAIRATNHGGHTMVRNQIGLYLYDDFAFYRGLIRDLVDWSAASSVVATSPMDEYGVGAFRSLELSNAGSSMIRWALGIHPGSRWNESKLQLKEKNNFTLQTWNRKPLAKPTTKVSAKDLGLTAKGDVLEVQLPGPAYRTPAEVEVQWGSDGIGLHVSQPVKLRIDYAAFVPKWDDKTKFTIRRAGKPAVTLTDKEVTQTGTVIEFQAETGFYDIIRSK